MRPQGCPRVAPSCPELPRVTQCCEKNSTRLKFALEWNRKKGTHLWFALKWIQQGCIHDIRCVPVLHYAIFSDFYKSVTDGPMDGRTDGPTDRPTYTPSYRDARTHLKSVESLRCLLSHYRTNFRALSSIDFLISLQRLVAGRKISSIESKKREDWQNIEDWKETKEEISNEKKTA